MSRRNATADAARDALAALEEQGLVRRVIRDGQVVIERTEGFISVSEAALLVRPTVQAAAQFRQIFGVPVTDFRDALAGFDPIAFNRWLERSPEDGDLSVLDVVRNRFGERACEVVMAVAAGAAGGQMLQCKTAPGGAL